MRHEDQGLHEILYNKKARFFYKWFINGGAVGLFTDILKFEPERAKAEASRLSRNVEAYCTGLYQEELRFGAFRKSYGAFLDEPRVIAVNINYIAKSLMSEYPDRGHQIISFIKSKLAGSEEKSRNHDE